MASSRSPTTRGLRSSRTQGAGSRTGAVRATHGSGWTFLSNHGHVLLCLAGDPQMALRDVAQTVGITERSVQRIVGELEEGGYLERRREGRRNRYVIRRAVPLRHPIEKHRRVGDLIAMVLDS